MRRTGALLGTILLLSGCAQAQDATTQPSAAPVAATTPSTTAATPTPSPTPSVAVTVPDVVGLTYGDAQTTLAALGLTTTPDGRGTIVTAQAPAAGLSVWAPGHVTITMGSTATAPAAPSETPAPARTYAAYAIDAAISGALPSMPAGTTRDQARTALVGVCDQLDAGATLDDVDGALDTAGLGTSTPRHTIIGAAVGGLCPTYYDATIDWFFE